jgi:hypothetical protein
MGTVTISPYGQVCPLTLHPILPHVLSGNACGGKWWLSPFSGATKGFFASLRMARVGV